MTRVLPIYTHRDVHLLEAAASLAHHQPAEKRSAHMVARLEELAQRIRETLPAEPEAVDPSPAIPLEAMGLEPEDIIA